MSKFDYLTTVKSVQRANKLVIRKPDGTIKKTAGIPISIATAETHHVPDQASMTALLNKIAEDPRMALIQGFFPGSPAGSPFKVLSTKEMMKALGIEDSKDPALLGWHEIDGEPTIARLKLNTVPSSWQQFDRDIVKGMPDELANLTETVWLAKMEQLIPTLHRAGLIRVASTSGRVVVDGEPMESSGSRWWYQIQDPNDLDRFAASILLNSFSEGIGFNRPRYSRKDPDKILNHVPWSIFDPTVFSSERLVFDGKPSVRGEGIEVGPPQIEVIRESEHRVDTLMVHDPGESEKHKLEYVNRQRLVLQPDGSNERRLVPTAIVVDTQELKLDTVIETQSGKMKIIDYWNSGKGKLRCQTPFRDSDSWNGILNKHSDNGTPFVFDNGTRIKYTLSPEDVDQTLYDQAVETLEKLNKKQILHTWTTEAVTLSKLNQEKLRRWVHEQTDEGLTALKDQLKEALVAYKLKKHKAQIAKKKREAIAAGRLPIEWEEHRLPEVAEGVTSQLIKPHPELVMTMAQSLVRVIDARPVTVRQIQRLYELGEDYPAVKMFEPYNLETLRLRVMNVVDLYITDDYNQKPISIAPPVTLLRTLLKNARDRAKPVSGIVTWPCVRADGSLLNNTGHDQQTGLYVNLGMNIPEPASCSPAASLKWMRETLLADWEFKSVEDQDAAVAMFLTGMQRKILVDQTGCPGFAVSAPVQASGKTAMLQLLSNLVFDRPVAATAWTTDETEMAKHLVAILREGHPMVLFDNVQEGDAISGNEISKAVTNPTYSNRLLGENRDIALPTSVLWVWTGNNIITEGDFNSRTLLIYIDPKTERPDKRKFSRRCLQTWAESHRLEFFAHALNILATPAAEAPSSDTRFKQWEKMIYLPMRAAGATPFLDLLERNMTEDAKGEERRELLEALHDVFGSKPFKLNEVVKIMDDYNYDNTPENTLEEIVKHILPGGRITSRSLASTLRKFTNRRFGEYWIEKSTHKNSKKSAKWVVHKQQQTAVKGG